MHNEPPHITISGIVDKSYPFANSKWQFYICNLILKSK